MPLRGESERGVPEQGQCDEVGAPHFAPSQCNEGVVGGDRGRPFTRRDPQTRKGLESIHVVPQIVASSEV